MTMKIAGVDLCGAPVVVLGLARSGVAAIQLLHQHGAHITASDAKPLDLLPEARALVAAGIAQYQPQSSLLPTAHQLLVISPGVPVDAPPVTAARAAGIPVIGELELASYFLLGPILAITGSNGKTTTTALTGHILRVAGIPNQVGGNIGTPPAAMVASSRPNQWNVLEVSSFQLETIHHFRASIGVCLNLTPDHLDRHYTMENYEAAKRRLFETQSSDCFAVLNADDAACLRYAAHTPARPLWFSVSRPVTPGLWLDGEQILFDNEPLLSRSDIPLRGLHNVENVLAAAGAARLAGASPAAIRDAVASFPGVEHRLEFVRRCRGVDYFNDSKATNVDATLKALDAFHHGLWVILGGKDKGSDYSPLAAPLRRKAKAALLIGAAAPKIAAALASSVPLIHAGELSAAVHYAAAHASPGDTVLLAPACASFDQFDNFEHRGRVFKQLVAALEDTQQ
jgi:UDP-N-acetylmuramoylalanine--D-glutamate ligase